MLRVTVSIRAPHPFRVRCGNVGPVSPSFSLAPGVHFVGFFFLNNNKKINCVRLVSAIAGSRG